MRTRDIKIVGVLGFSACLCFLVTAHVFKGYSPLQAITFFLAPSPQELCQIGEPTAQSLEAYFRVHGQYPQSLEDGGIVASDTFFGSWIYSVRNDGRSCALAVGDYGRYLFVVVWSPEYGWYIDT
jgi:hypothetical protein